MIASEITSDDIRRQRFTSQLLWGLSRAEVLAFLQDVADAYEDLQMTNVSLRRRGGSLAEKVEAGSAGPSSARDLESRCDTGGNAESMVNTPGDRRAAVSSDIKMLRAAALREVEALLHDAQAHAQLITDGAKEQEAAILRDAEAARARLQIEADVRIASAIAKAESLVADARDQQAALCAEIERLDRSRMQLIDDIRERLGTYHQLLATLDPRGRSEAQRTGDLSNAAGDSVDVPDQARSA